MEGRIRRWWWVVALVLIALAVAAALFWAATPLGPSPSALAALESDDSIRVARTEAGYEFSPVGVEPTAALVFYPGGRVDVRSYATYAREVARAGYLVVVPAMPLSLAVLDAKAADKAFDAHPQIDSWVVGGHSLGGAMAASYLDENQGDVAGLLLLAAYPPGNTDLSEQPVAVTDVTASEDRILDAAVWEDARDRLPEDTQVVAIEGGNHAGFGDYGSQPGDGNASISASQQRRQTVRATVELMRRSSQAR